MIPYTTGRDLEALIELAKPARGILEFGTANGQTTLALAQACPLATIRTVDVDIDLVPLDAYQRCDLRPREKVGQAFHGTTEAERITQVWADPNGPYDLDAMTPAGWLCDLAFIDGLHSLEGVSKDTLAAVRIMLRGPRQGVLVWDDRSSAGVPTLLGKIGKAKDIPGTRLAVLEAGEAELRWILDTMRTAPML